MPDFYIQRGDDQFGPFQSSKLKELADSGNVIPSDMIRKDEDGKWYPASTVKGLFSLKPVEHSPDVRDTASELDAEADAEDDALAILMESADVSVTAPSAATAQDVSPRSTPTEAPEPADTNPNLQACRDCGTMVSKRAAACPSCGAPLLETEDSPELKACRDCGTMVPEQSAACPRCGIPFWDSEKETAPSHKSSRQRTGVLFLAVTVAILLSLSFLVLLGFKEYQRTQELQKIRQISEIDGQLKAEAEAETKKGFHANNELKNHSTAILHFTEAIKIANQMQGMQGASSRILGSAYNGLGLCYLGKGDLDKAVVEFNEAIRIGEATSRYDLLGVAHSHRSTIYRLKAEKASTAKERARFESLADQEAISSTASFMTEQEMTRRRLLRQSPLNPE